jgi:hypothetical protein
MRDTLSSQKSFILKVSFASESPSALKPNDLGSLCGNIDRHVERIWYYFSTIVWYKCVRARGCLLRARKIVATPLRVDSCKQSKLWELSRATNVSWKGKFRNLTRTIVSFQEVTYTSYASWWSELGKCTRTIASTLRVVCCKQCMLTSMPRKHIQSDQH